MLSVKTYFSGLDETVGPDQSKTSAQRSRKLKHNAVVSYALDQSQTVSMPNLIVITSSSGSEFRVPILSPVSNLLPIPDGLLIEVPFSASDSARAKLERVNGGGLAHGPSQYLYLSLTFHPLNNYRPIRISEQVTEANFRVT
jgi:hypothetical protein